ncbi:MAG: PAS domain S-box protein [Desulfitobacteriaceae bacterium]
MSTEKVKTKLEAKVTFLEAALERVQKENEIWNQIFTENYWGMALCDALSGEFLKVNPYYAAMHGYSISELISKSMSDVYAPECQKGLSEIVHIIRDRGHYAYNSFHVRKDGSYFPVHVITYEITENGRRLRVVAVWDITESEDKEKESSQYREDLEELVKSRTKELQKINKQLRKEIMQREAAEHKLIKANQEMVNILEGISDGFMAVNHQWEITYTNKTLVETLRGNGIKDNLLMSNFWETLTFGKEVNDYCLKVMEDGQATRFETYSPLMGHWVEFSIYPTANGISIFSRSIDEKKKIEKAIEEEHHRLYSLFDNFPGLILVQEEDHKIRFANRSFYAKFGRYKEKPCYEVMAGLNFPCNDCVTSTVFRRSTPLRQEKLFDNRVYESYIQPFTDADGSKLVVKVLIDITERKNAERELARLDRLNIVGEMAAGIAHEIRNPMTTVRGFLQILASKDDTKQYHEFYELMIEELDRANSIITNFLSLAKDKPTDFKITNISQIAKSLSPLLSADALIQDKEIRFELEHSTDIHGNENELRQLILNLARNGLESMQCGAILTIQTLLAGNYVILRICDQGRGFDPVILDKLGTPFLTTKEQGTGLGLAICQSIVTRHNAEMNFESNPAGTTVTVRFTVGNR